MGQRSSLSEILFYYLKIPVHKQFTPSFIIMKHARHANYCDVHNEITEKFRDKVEA